jgi:hypothetical protein
MRHSCSSAVGLTNAPRVFRRINKIRKRLGYDAAMAAPFPDRPKGM